MEWGWLFLKAAIGSSLFTVILWGTQSRNPRAAGMMLTFPAFNGLGLLAAESQHLSLMGRAMLPLILTNGVLCAGYILGYDLLGRHLRCCTARTRALLLLFASLLMWGVMAVFLAPLLQHQLFSWKRITLFFLLYCLGAWLLTTRCLWRPGQEYWPARQNWGQVWRANAGKVSVLFVLLVLVMLCARWGADAWAGRLSTLPVLPLYSLLVLATRTSPLSHGVARLEQLGRTVLVGPVLACAFVWGFSGYLRLLGQSHGGGALLVWGLTGLLTGWSLCGGLIWAIGWALQRMEQRA
jgi:hypothetical protein